MPSLGLLDALFINTGTYASPTLVKVDGIEKLGFPDERTAVLIKIRRHTHELNLLGQAKKGLTFNLLTEPGNTVWELFHTAYNAGAAKELFVFYKYNDSSGAPTSGDKAIRMHVQFTKFERNQNLEEGDFNDVECVPTIKLQDTETSVHEPAIYTVS